MDHEGWVRAALTLARRGLGSVWPNPAVGCIIVNGREAVGYGWTQSGGRPHAEVEALRRAGERSQGAIAYVTFEPCPHHGETAPCADALIRAGIARVVVSARDPDPRVSGRGIARLKNAGVEIITPILEAESLNINLGFILRVTQGRPLFTLKSAASLDGRVALSSGESQWITGERARAEGHRLRWSHDAVLVGVGTAMVDDPVLTPRLPGLNSNGPVRVVVDTKLRLRVDAQVVRTAGLAKTWVLTTSAADGQRRRRLMEAGVSVIDVSAGDDNRVDPRAIARVLGDHGITRVLIEGGGNIATSFIRTGLVDRIALFQAPIIVGSDAQPMVSSLNVVELAAAPTFARRDVRTLGSDVGVFVEQITDLTACLPAL